MQGPRRVLVIDDEPDLVEMIRMALERMFEVIPAYNGQVGIAKARADRPDVIVLRLSRFPRAPGHRDPARVRQPKGGGRSQ